MTTIAIDLGTTNSLVAYWNHDQPVIIPNVHGSKLTPSVISITDTHEVLVGEAAKHRLITHPNMTVSNFKRFMGTNKKYQLGRYNLSPVELSSFVLQSLKEDAEAYLGTAVKKAIISVPAYFNDAQRAATKHAAELAGLTVIRLISEPTAAAISYGLHQQEPETMFMIFDLGGGTYDVSILEMFEGIMEVKAISGDCFLGGTDFTEALVNHFLKDKNISLEYLDAKSKSALYKEAEICKHQLSEQHSVTMKLLLDEQSLEQNITREDFESISNNLLLKLRKPILQAMNDSRISTDELDAIILVGGATRMPLIHSVITKIFHRFPYTNINPDEAIALGAATQVALMERNASLDEVILTDVCPFTLGTEVVKKDEKGNIIGSCFLPIIERNTIIPVSKVERLYSILDYQDFMTIGIYQGESLDPSKNLYLGRMKILIPEAKAGEVVVDVRYTYDINGILEIEVTTINTGEVSRLVIENHPGTLSKREIDEMLQKLKKLKIHPREQAENQLLLARGERLYEETLGDVRTSVGSLLINFNHALSKQNPNHIQRMAIELKKAFDHIERQGEF